MVFALIANAAKKKRTPPRSLSDATPGGGGSPRGPASGGMLDELRRAMEELKRAELQQVAREQGQAPAESRSEQQAAAATRWLAEQKRRAASRPPMGSGQPMVALPSRQPVRRPVRPLEDDDADKSSEDEPLAAPTDYDEEAERIIAAREKAAVRVVREEASSEELSTLQKARREARTAAPIGGTAEHAAWHQEIGGQGDRGTEKPRTGRLGRYADGSVRGALVLSEILGRPKGDRADA